MGAKMDNRNLLIVDDEPAIIRSLERELRPEGYAIHTAATGAKGLDLLKQRDFGVILSDYMMPEMDGIAFLELAKEQMPDSARILLTGYGSLNNAMNAVNFSHIFGYLTKPWPAGLLKETIARGFEHHQLIRENKELQRVTSAQNDLLKCANENLEDQVRERTRQLQEALREGLKMLALAAEAKDDSTGDHINRIQKITAEICRGLGLPREQCDLISFSSIMHDVGKIHIPDNILKKAGPLSPEERRIMQTHTAAGEKILGENAFYETARQIARSHHERWDGTGYPDGLKGEEIPLSARIVAVADVYDALTHERPYKAAWTMEKALSEMRSLSGALFDPIILDIFMRYASREVSDG